MKLGFTYKEAVGQIIGDLEIIGYDDERNELELQRFNNGEIKNKINNYIICKCLICGNIFSRSFSNLISLKLKCLECGKKEIKENRIGQKQIMNCGMECEIIEYNDSNDITVKFEDGTILKNKTYASFKKGSIRKLNIKKSKIDIEKYEIIGMDEERNELELQKFKNGETLKAQKYIKYKCLKCGSIFSIQKGILNIKKCKNCNSISNVRPDLIKFLKNKEDANKYSYGSMKKIDVICPICGYEKNVEVRTFVLKGLRCNKCSDSFSYNERFVLILLEKIKSYFEIQKKFKWSQNKIYDFYIPSLNCIVETHGEQHYKEIDFFCKTLEEEQENDQLKEQLAKENGIEHYIVLDCRKSELDWIKNSILNSKLSELFDLSKIDWNECELNTRNKSLIEEVCKLYKKNYTHKEISNKLKISTCTVYNYLKVGNEINLCNHEIQSAKKTKLDGIIFNSINSCAKYANIRQSSISSFLSGKSPMPKELFDRGLIYLDETIEERNNRVRLSKKMEERKTVSKKVICENIIFNSVKEASKYYKINLRSFNGYLTGKVPITEKFYNMGLRYANETIEIRNKRVIISNFNNNKIAIKCENKTFDSLLECSNFYKLKNSSNIASYLSGKKSMPKKWYDMGLRYANETIEERNNRVKLSKRKSINRSCKKVIYENIIFDSIKKCSNYLNVKSSTLCGWLNGSYKMPQKWKDRGLAYYIESEENE